MILFIFGDSITQGFWDTEGGWADRIKCHVTRRCIQSDLSSYHGVYNLGIDGDTTPQLLERLESELSARIPKNEDCGFIIAIGTNDSLIDGNGTCASSTVLYESQLIELHKLASKFSSNMAYVNLLPVNESLTNPLPSSSSGKRYGNTRIEQFNEVLEQHCKSINAKLINARSKFLGNNNLLFDGLHPNSDGHELIYETIMPVINSWLFEK